ncbi:MAG: RNA polymerase sigma factor [Deltaproteobacteria bacterium]|nr:RNA polymerase sigma factor [Deltaproteobacteria bacterium]
MSKTDPSDETSVGPAFAAIYREHHSFVWRNVKRLGVAPGEVDDVVQEVFIVAHRRLQQFEGRSKLSTWLFGIAYRVVKDHRLSVEARQRREAGVTEPRAPTVPDRKVSRQQAAQVLDQLLERLDPEKRDVFVMAEVAKLSAPEIAETLGVKVNTVYSRLRAARKEFESLLDKHRAQRSSGLPWLT